jgi:uncharacterized protein
MTTHAPDTTLARPLRFERPGWPEIALAIPLAVVLYLVAGTAVVLLAGDEPARGGLLNFASSALVPIVVFAAVVPMRIRDLRPFGFRRVRPWWLLAAAGIGLANLALSWPVSFLVDPLIPGAGEVQAGYRDAATAGPLPLIATVVLGGILTPFGEELLFRGVIARFLLRWKTPVAVILSAAIFAVAHGVNDVTPMAFVIGLCNGLLLRYSGSIWPGIVVHMVYNTSGMLVHALGV